MKKLAAGQTGTGNGMVERLGLRLRRWRGDERGLGFGWSRGAGKKADFFADSAAKVVNLSIVLEMCTNPGMLEHADSLRLAG